MINKILERTQNKKDTVESTGTEEMYVTIRIGEELFGLDVSRVKEVMGMTQISHVPNSMEYMKGVINLRDVIIPLIDMRVRFKLESKEYDKLTVIVITEINEKTIGLIVDSVSDVVNLPIANVQDTPHFSTSIDADCIKGIGKIGEEIVIILDVDRLFTLDELENIHSDE